MLKQILIDHSRRYPLMDPTDAVKLIYQNEFGGGHLIRDEESCLAYLRREYESVAQTDAPLTEDIGNGFVRIYLNALDAHGYSLAQLGKDFIRSAEAHRGTLDSFLEKLALLRQIVQDGHFAFSPDELDCYLSQYKQAGYPMVSHSDRYRETYHPAYRIVLKSLLNAE